MAAILKVVPGVKISKSFGSFYCEIPNVDNFLLSKQEVKSTEPVLIHRDKHKLCDHWLYEFKVYVTSDQQLTPADVSALLNEVANRRRLQLEKAHALQAMTEELSKGPKREHIAQDVKVLVWQRDGGRCVSCGSQSDLEFDHIIPIAMGGSVIFNSSANHATAAKVPRWADVSAPPPPCVVPPALSILSVATNDHVPAAALCRACRCVNA